ncbi:recombinase RecT [Mycolicibacterium llatzerense]|uniref:recombinase RecT n=1 Tax=Mycolicibacterium llatzerense TaxID=280871 RepID=UPI0021B6DA43|nr:recombinase RecT [Mycolicibacterium llatzerense]MCT7369422.1 hypothetical protein [Mycolicibacterium llatzerense]
MTEIATAARPNPPKTISGVLNVLIPELARAVPKGMDADRIARIVQTEIRKSRNAKSAGIAKQSLEDCTQESFAGALLTSSALGLEPGINGECYLVPYRDNRRRVVECQLILGYQGIVKLFWQHPRARGIQTGWVCENDHFVHEDGLNPILVHKKAEGDRGAVTHFWAIVKVADAEPLVTVLTADEVKEIRRGKVGSSGDIKDPQRWMERKTVLKQALKLAPKTTRLDAAIAADDRPGTDLSRSQALAIPSSIAQTPSYIEGEVLASDAAAVFDQEPAGAHAEVHLASAEQLKQLDQIRAAEKLDGDNDAWHALIGSVIGRDDFTTVSDLTPDEAAKFIAYFSDTTTK